ncbi:MAG TPA: 50S ribosomal protein L29 [Candidatus Parcubacteria bacterium]|nr:50S ribosomal protein L29 [Candidatus Parcubacteria bacterium]
MKMSEIKQRAEKELKEDLARKRDRLRELRFELAAGKVKGIKEIRLLKKDIARILTYLNEKK